MDYLVVLLLAFYALTVLVVSYTFALNGLVGRFWIGRDTFWQASFADWRSWATGLVFGWPVLAIIAVWDFVLVPFVFCPLGIVGRDDLELAQGGPPSE